MRNDQEIFADNAAPFNTIKLLSAGLDGCVKKHIVDIAAQTVSKESQLSAQSTKSVTIVKQEEFLITSIAMSSDTHTLFVANDKGIITQFQKEDSSLNYYPIRTLKGHTKCINQISLSNSKMHLLSASEDESLRAWDLDNGNQLVCLNEKRQEHQSGILSCCWNGQDTLFASGDYYGSIVVWSLPLSKYNSSNKFIPLCMFNGQGDFVRIQCLAFQENGLGLFASYAKFYTAVIRLWSINEKELLDSKSTNITLPFIKQPKLESNFLHGFFYSFDMRESMFVVGVGELILPLSANSLQSMVDAVEFEKVHIGSIYSLVFSNDGKYVVSGSIDGSVAIFDSISGKCVKLIENDHIYRGRVIVLQI